MTNTIRYCLSLSSFMAFKSSAVLPCTGLVLHNQSCILYSFIYPIPQRFISYHFQSIFYTSLLRISFIKSYTFFLPFCPPLLSTYNSIPSLCNAPSCSLFYLFSLSIPSNAVYYSMLYYIFMFCPLISQFCIIPHPILFQSFILSNIRSNVGITLAKDYLFRSILWGLEEAFILSFL